MDRFTKTNSLYDKYAKQFADKLDKIPETEQLDEFIKMLPLNATVLDLGCGSGRDAEYLSKAGLKVTGIDISEGLIKEAKIRRPEINFMVMDLLKSDLPDNFFSGVWSKLTILHIERDKLPQLLSKIYAILRPGGIVYLETKAGSGEAFEKVSFNENESRLFIYYEQAELEDLLRSAGFKGVKGYEYAVDNEHATHVKDRVVVYANKP